MLVVDLTHVTIDNHFREMTVGTALHLAAERRINTPQLSFCFSPPPSQSLFSHLSLSLPHPFITGRCSQHCVCVCKWVFE